MKSNKEGKSFEHFLLNIDLNKLDKQVCRNYDKGKYIYEQSLHELKKDSFQFRQVDYWNMMIALYYFGESDKNIRKAFEKAYEKDPNETCVVLHFFNDASPAKLDSLSKIIKIIPYIIADCKPEKEIEINLEEYCKENNLDYNLVKLISMIKENDQKYRTSLELFRKNTVVQQKIDSINLHKIDSLYKIHQNYIGKSLVGKKFDFVMWAVIQHSNIKKMKEYLPIIHQAVINEQLPITPLKMLIDRINQIENGYQIFGSQGGIEIAHDSIRNKVIKQYNLKDL